MQFKTLLPLLNGKQRTGYVFDTDDGLDIRVQVAHKLVTDDTGSTFLQMKLWTRDAGFYTHFAVDMGDHSIIAMESHSHDKGAWRRLVNALRTKYWNIPKPSKP